MDRINFKHKLPLILLLASLAPGISFAADCTIPSANTYRVGVAHDGYLVTVLDSKKSGMEQGTCQSSHLTLTVHFPFDKATLSRAQKQQIAQLVKQGAVQFDVIGYTDSSGTKAYNQRLGKARARAVRHYLAHLGVANSQVVIRSAGESHPVASNATPAGRALNRRAVITTK
ncbi:OmpA family protein [Celerinatantimonas diazotrophica]|uniref:OmpA family protein n=1 Tax=Celerinatantimonas diazotrophica TaxID=412034 RepID=A0A4V2PSU3_9GAMM|nr:OmpA family protein [Celerinatantimonas diazotrophica]TCK64001.1 OmpA family protein [Celerinatantimonas diazotrophica]CAG9297092.1 Peptidoglycan-associated lipoprotein [Celerinatantimonas diazotrophica]